MNFNELRAELAKKENLKCFTLSGYDSVRKNELLQIYKSEWMPCKFFNTPLELHFEIQDNRILRLDCHWYPYNQHKNLNQDELVTKFPHLEQLIEKRKKFIVELSAEAQKEYNNDSRLRQVKFNALSGIEWVWEGAVDWTDIAEEIAEIVTAVSQCVDNHFGKELSKF